MPDLYFLTNNDYKFVEYDRPARRLGLPLKRWPGDLQEIQELDFHEMARQKVVAAYSWLMHPVLVDVSGMHLSALNGLPGGLNRQFWDLLHGNICEIVHALGDPSASMVVCLALCDGQRVYFGDGQVAGTLARHESAVGTFHLDRTFVPHGATVMSELTPADRDRLGPRSLALADLVAKLRGTAVGREFGIR